MIVKQIFISKIVLNSCGVFYSIWVNVGPLLDSFWSLFCILLASWGASGLVLGAFGHRLWSTWGSWVQLGRLGVALGSHFGGFG